MSSGPLEPSVGWGVLHLFYRVTPATDAPALAAAVKGAEGDGMQVVCFSVLGHKADLGVMLIGPDWVALRRAQSSLTAAGVEATASYVSLTEVSEYAQGMPAEMLDARLHPKLPPEGKRAYCFYPMSKQRGEHENWYRLDFEDRKRMMIDHGKSGRRFAGRILQLITASTGVDDFEWGVSLFGVHPDDLKDAVHAMRFDEASARFAVFGPFYAGVVGEIDEVMAQLGLV